MTISKYFKKLVKIVFYLLSPILILIILIARPFTKIRFSYQSSERLGDIATHMEVYLSEKKISGANEYLDIFILTDIISNKTYIELLKKRVIILPNFITYPVYHTIKIFENKFKFLQSLVFQTKFDDNNFSIVRTECSLMPSSEFIKKGNDFLKSINIPQEAKIICLIVRDDEYLKKKFPKKNWDYQKYRNCDIDNYKTAIIEATKRGYYVFRMGEHVKKELIIKDNNKFIDYSKKYRSDFLDIFLGYKCNFCITTGTGWDCIPAFTFRKPVIFTNYTPVGNLLTYSKDFLFSIKVHYDLNKKKKLNLKEISQSLVAYANNAKLFEISNIELQENNPEDLKDLTIEMIDRLEGNLTFSKEEENLQDTFWSKYVDYFMLQNIKPEVSKKINPLWCTTKRLYNNKIISRIGNNFLKKNNFLIY